MAEPGGLRDPDAIMRLLRSKEDIELFTELSDVQTEAVSKIELLADAFHSPALRSHIRHYLILQVSNGRKGRGEFVEALKSKTQQLADKAKGLALFG